MSLEEPVSLKISLAISMTVNSRGLPILTGSCTLGHHSIAGSGVQELLVRPLFDCLIGVDQ